MLFQHDLHPLQDVWVSLDLETTGLSADSDEIIEIGAVKFKGDNSIETFQSFVNPNRELSSFISSYTGISQDQVDNAVQFSSIAPGLISFIGKAPIVGHNIAFDIGFLSSKGLKLSNPLCDTWDLAYVLLPEIQEYSLSRLASTLGINHPRPHRAVDDAVVTSEVFNRLVHIAEALDSSVLDEMSKLAAKSDWVVSYLLQKLQVFRDNPTSGLQKRYSDPGVAGMDLSDLRSRFQHQASLKQNSNSKDIDVEQCVALLSKGSHLSTTMPGFEERVEQFAMARSVCEVINGGGRLIVEAGTGVGKSLAYLVPAVMYALLNNKRVLVSTNTINLQEQLLTKDIPAMIEGLDSAGVISMDELKYCVLKGRNNYLCLRRWFNLSTSEGLSEDEARILSKILVWLQSTETGDRNQLNLGSRNASLPWNRLSAQGAQECIGVSGVCFLRAARDQASASHLVIVNHALLMSDIGSSRSLLPDYDILIVDEAHHLEDQATTLLGFELGQRGIDEHLQTILGEQSLMNKALSATSRPEIAESRRKDIGDAIEQVNDAIPQLRENIALMFAQIDSLVSDQDDRARFNEKRITISTRSQPDWSQLEIQWENVDVLLDNLQSLVSTFLNSMQGLDEAGIHDYESIISETGAFLQSNNEIRDRLRQFIPNPEKDTVYWTTRSRRSNDLILRAAPLHVGSELEKRLFSQKETVVLTSATLSTEGSFDHIVERTGFSNAKELLLGSPFDYPNSALMCVPTDVPEPSSKEYQSAIEQTIVDSTIAADGRSMALFTSHSSLRATAVGIRSELQSHGIEVFAQGLDGTPYQVLDRFVKNPRSVLLGTSSFWEGVDLAGESLKVLLMTRLPFDVPSEPVFEARSELYDDSFNAYAIPKAILRLRQGFGRLIRTKTDKGVVVVLDKRMISRRYGKLFVNSLPDVTLQQIGMDELSDQIKEWLK